jgi:hypothetical protein
MLSDKSDFLLYLKCTRTSTHTFYICRTGWVKFGMQDLYVIALTEFRENLCDESPALPEVVEDFLYFLHFLLFGCSSLQEISTTIDQVV